MNNVENKKRITVTLLAEEWLSMHQIFIKCETAQQLYMRDLQWIWCKSLNIYRNYTKKFINTHKQNVTVTQTNQTTIMPQLFVKKSYITFHDNSTNGLVVDIRSQTNVVSHNANFIKYAWKH